MRSHPEIGAWRLEEIPIPQDARSIVRIHSEGEEDSGCPQSLKDTALPRPAGIDLDGLFVDRLFREKIMTEEALFYLSIRFDVRSDLTAVRFFEAILLSGQRLNPILNR